MSNELIFRKTPDGEQRIEVVYEDENFWMSQRTLAELFAVGVPTINKHLKNIFESGEIDEKGTISKMETVRQEYAADGITPQEIEAVIKQLEAYSAADLYESNKAIMKLVSDGFLLKREDRSQKDLYIQLIDFLDLGSDTDIRKAL